MAVPMSTMGRNRAELEEAPGPPMIAATFTSGQPVPALSRLWPSVGLHVRGSGPDLHKHEAATVGGEGDHVEGFRRLTLHLHSR